MTILSKIKVIIYIITFSLSFVIGLFFNFIITILSAMISGIYYGTIGNLNIINDIYISAIGKKRLNEVKL
jgi:hypothetical protein